MKRASSGVGGRQRETFRNPVTVEGVDTAVWTDVKKQQKIIPVSNTALEKACTAGIAQSSSSAAHRQDKDQVLSTECSTSCGSLPSEA